MNAERSPASSCAVCGGPGRYVRDPRSGDPSIWCADHAPAALPPWVMVARILVALAALGAGITTLGRWLQS